MTKFRVLLLFLPHPFLSWYSAFLIFTLVLIFWILILVILDSSERPQCTIIIHIYFSFIKSLSFLLLLGQQAAIAFLPPSAFHYPLLNFYYKLSSSDKSAFLSKFHMFFLFFFCSPKGKTSGFHLLLRITTLI